MRCQAAAWRRFRYHETYWSETPAARRHASRKVQRAVFTGRQAAIGRRGDRLLRGRRHGGAGCKRSAREFYSRVGSLSLATYLRGRSRAQVPASVWHHRAELEAIRPGGSLAIRHEARESADFAMIVLRAAFADPCPCWRRRLLHAQPQQPHRPQQRFPASAARDPQEEIAQLRSALVRLPLAAVLASHPRRAAAAAGDAASQAGRHRDANHPGGRGRGRHARRGIEPRARLRHRRRRRARALPREDRRPEGCGRDAVHACGRTGGGRRSLDDCDFLNRLHSGHALCDRVARAERRSPSSSSR